MSKLVILGAGHGLNTPGKQTPTGIKEWTLNDAVLRQVVDNLSRYDVRVIREDDPTGINDVSLNARNDLVKKMNPDLYISIHHNANTGVFGDWSGFEVFYMQDDENLADRLVPFLDKWLGISVNGTVIKRHGDPSKMKDLQVLRNIPKSIKACLVEIGFMDSNNDYKYITDKTGQLNAAMALTQFIITELSLQLKTLPWKEETTKWGVENGIFDGTRLDVSATRVEVVKMIKNYHDNFTK